VKCASGLQAQMNSVLMSAPADRSAVALPTSSRSTGGEQDIPSSSQRSTSHHGPFILPTQARPSTASAAPEEQQASKSGAQQRAERRASADVSVASMPRPASRTPAAHSSPERPVAEAVGSAERAAESAAACLAQDRCSRLEDGAHHDTVLAGGNDDTAGASTTMAAGLPKPLASLLAEGRSLIASARAWELDEPATEYAGLARAASMASTACADAAVETVAIDTSTPLAQRAARAGAQASTAQRSFEQQLSTDFASAAGDYSAPQVAMHAPGGAAAAAPEHEAAEPPAPQNNYLARLQWPPIKSVLRERSWLHDALNDSSLDISARSSDAAAHGGRVSGKVGAPVRTSVGLSADGPTRSSTASWAQGATPPEGVGGLAAGLQALDSMQGARKLGGLAFGEDSKENVASPDKQGSWGFRGVQEHDDGAPVCTVGCRLHLPCQHLSGGQS
jgi:hypothetical protein